MTQYDTVVLKATRHDHTWWEKELLRLGFFQLFFVFFNTLWLRLVSISFDPISLTRCLSYCLHLSRYLLSSYTETSQTEISCRAFNGRTTLGGLLQTSLIPIPYGKRIIEAASFCCFSTPTSFSFLWPHFSRFWVLLFILSRWFIAFGLFLQHFFWYFMFTILTKIVSTHEVTGNNRKSRRHYVNQVPVSKPLCWAL